jgi:hypothetical protein
MGGRTSTSWKPGRDIQTLAQQHGPAAIATLAAALKSRNERVRVAAAAILLDRGYGRAPQNLTLEGGDDHWAQHLLAARLVAQELRTERAALEATRPLIEATNGSAAEPQPDDLLQPALE